MGNTSVLQDYEKNQSKSSAFDKRGPCVFDLYLHYLYCVIVVSAILYYLLFKN